MKEETVDQVRLVSVRQVMEMTGLSVFTIYSWVSQKKIPYVKMGKRVLFDVRDINEWIEANKVHPEA